MIQWNLIETCLEQKCRVYANLILSIMNEICGYNKGMIIFNVHGIWQQLYNMVQCITGNNSIKIEFLERKLEKKFEMSKLGLLTIYIGIEFQRLATGMLLFTELVRKVWNVRMRTNGHTHGGGNQITPEHGGRFCNAIE